jgi:uncharacterized SAM-binding protein YcdF (DUF218 family)
MFLPGSLIWKRMGDEWLAKETAAVLFAISCVVIVLATAVLWIGLPSMSPLSIPSICVGLLGLACPVAMFFLWGGMLRYWMRGEPASLQARRFWFAILILGLFYGAIVYFGAVYLPTRKNNSHSRSSGQ